jgi:valyl-tRNA synthetase
VQGSRNFCNKLWNATRFALLNGASTVGPVPAELGVVDRWILSRLNAVVAEVDGYYEEYEFAKAAELLYHFAWDEVCDWYLELAKVSLGPPGEPTPTAAATRRVLGEVLDLTLRLLHPMIPFVTETLWTELTGGESLVVTAWPEPDPTRGDPAAEDSVRSLQLTVLELRRFLSSQGVKPSQKVPARVNGPIEFEPEIRSLVKLVQPGPDFARTGNALDTQWGATIELDLSTSIDVGAERARLTRDRAVAEKDLEQTAKKLGNEAFLGKAPESVVAGIRARNQAAQLEIARIDAALAGLPSA